MTGSDTRGDCFGESVDLDPGRIVVGAPGANAAYVFRADSTGWTEEDKLVPFDGILNNFGSAVGISGDRVVVGERSDTNANGQSAGSAFVFRRQGIHWIFEQKLLASDGNTNHFFGTSVAIDDDRLVVGSFPGNRAYVFERVGTVWSEELVFSFPQAGVGFDVDIDGDRCVFGAFGATIGGVQNSGAVFVHRRDPSGWVLEQAVVHDNPVAFDCLGLSVALDGDTLIAGAIHDDVPGVNCGSAYVFTRSGTSWSQQARLISPDGEQIDEFGSNVALDGDLAAVGQHQQQALPMLNSVYVFERSGTDWNSGSKVTPGTLLGGEIPIDIEGDRLLVGLDNENLAKVYVIPDPPTPYCTAKTNSAGCVPTIGSTGSASSTGPDDFVATATELLPSKPGLFFFGVQGSASLPFLGGTLCVMPPLKRTAVQQSTAGVACAGTLAFPFPQALMAQVGLIPGDRFHGQYWTRDRAHPDGTGVGLTDAIDVLVLP